MSAGAVGNYIRVGPPGDSYVILEKTLREDWVARSPALESDTYARALSVGFASAADRAAWRRDGSPSSWGYGQDLTFADPDGLSSGGTEKITTARGPLMNLFGGTGGVDPTKGQPASPARLKKILLRGYSRADSGGQSPASWIFQMAPRLFELPTTAAVRAGLYQLLASLPGVTSLGTVRDAGGQQGVAVALSSHVARCGGEYKLGLDNPLRLFPDCVVQQRIVIDPQTGEPLAQELRYLELPVGQKWSAPGGLFSYELFSPGRWTRAKLPPRGISPTQPARRLSPAELSLITARGIATSPIPGDAGISAHVTARPSNSSTSPGRWSRIVPGWHNQLRGCCPAGGLRPRP